MAIGVDDWPNRSYGYRPQGMDNDVRIRSCDRFEDRLLHNHFFIAFCLAGYKLGTPRIHALISTNRDSH